MSKFDDEMCFVVSLYGTALDATDTVRLMGDIIEFLRTAGQLPSHLSVTGRGFGKKPLLFDRGWKRLQKTAAADVEDVSVYLLAAGCDNPFVDWTVMCNIYPDMACFQLGASLRSMPDAEQRFIAFVRRSLARIRPAYGIGFFRPRSRGPSLYGLGISCGHHEYAGPEYEEGVAISRWSLGGFDEAVYNDGVLRDVYPYNLVTNRHLDRDVDGRSLRAWIRAEPSRGRLQTCQAGCVLWTVERDNVAELRKQLAAAGALSAWPP